MSEIHTPKYSTQYYVSGIRQTPTGQTEAGKMTADQWTQALNAISTTATTNAPKSQAELEQLVNQYQHLYAVIVDGSGAVPSAMEANAAAFANQFKNLFASLTSDTVRNSPKSQYLMVLGNLIQEDKTGKLSGYQQLIAEMSQADANTGPSQWERWAASTLALVVAQQKTMESSKLLQTINFTSEMASRDAEIEADQEAAQRRFDANNAKAGTQIAGGALQVGLAGAAGINAGKATVAKAEHQLQSAPGGNAEAATAALDRAKVAQAWSDGAAGAGQGSSSITQSMGGFVAADEEREADLAGTDAKGHSRDATGASDQGKAADSLFGQSAQAAAKVLDEVQNNTSANLQSMSRATQV